MSQRANNTASKVLCQVEYWFHVLCSLDTKYTPPPPLPSQPPPPLSPSVSHGINSIVFCFFFPVYLCDCVRVCACVNDCVSALVRVCVCVHFVLLLRRQNSIAWSFRGAVKQCREDIVHSHTQLLPRENMAHTRWIYSSSFWASGVQIRWPAVFFVVLVRCFMLHITFLSKNENRELHAKHLSIKLSAEELIDFKWTFHAVNCILSE